MADLASATTTLCIHVLPTLDELEVVQLNTQSGEVVYAATKRAPFDPNSRVLTSEDDFRAALNECYEESGLSISETPVSLILPSFFSREIENATLANSPEAEIRANLVEEVEKFYLFKKSEPELQYTQLTPERLFYSAFPKSEIDKLVGCFESLNAPLVHIELGMLSAVRGALAIGLMQPEIQDNHFWALYNLSDYAMSIVVCEGRSIRRCQETPLSVSSFDLNNIANEFRQETDRIFAEFGIKRVLLLNHSSKIEGEALASYLEIPAEVLVIDQTAFTLRSRDKASGGMYPCSLEAIGGCYANDVPGLQRVNFLPAEIRQRFELATIQKLAMLCSIGLLVGVAVLLALSYGGLSLWQNVRTDTLKSLQAKTSSFKMTEQLREVAVRRFGKYLWQRNVDVNNFTVDTARLLPKEMSISTITLMNLEATAETFDQAAPMVSVAGATTQPDLVNRFAKPLAEQYPSMNIVVGQIDPVFGEDGQSSYAWVIKTKEAPKPEGDQASAGTSNPGNPANMPPNAAGGPPPPH